MAIPWSPKSTTWKNKNLFVFIFSPTLFSICSFQKWNFISFLFFFPFITIICCRLWCRQIKIVDGCYSQTNKKKLCVFFCVKWKNERQSAAYRVVYSSHFCEDRSHQHHSVNDAANAKYQIGTTSSRDARKKKRKKTKATNNQKDKMYKNVY